MLISWSKADGVVRCKEHGVLPGNPDGALAKGTIMFEHLRDAHGYDMTGALAKLRAHCSPDHSVGA
jgi:hypothetical protein